MINKKVIAGMGVVAVLGAGVLVLDNPSNVGKAELTSKFNASEVKAKYVLNDVELVKTDIKNAELDKYKGEPKDEVKVTIGDNAQIGEKEFKPDIEMKRWNEVSFKLKTDTLLAGKKNKAVSFEGDKVKFTTDKMDFEMFDVPTTATDEGGYKYIWYLNEKPLTNKVEFQIESAGLDFFYQPPLNEEYPQSLNCSPTECDTDGDGALDTFRPENVVGSYAVYHSTKGGMNDVNGKEYKTGKAFHIFRPHIIDASGAETWGILHIENGIYSVEIPQEFLDTAVYPIKSNDTFGYTTQGASGAGIAASPNTSNMSGIAGALYDLAENGNITKMTVSLVSLAAQVIDVYVALFREDSVGADSHGLVASAENLNLSISTTATFYDFTFASESLTVDSYIFAALGNGEEIVMGASLQENFDTGGSGNRRYFETTSAAGSYNTRKAENPWTEIDAASNNRYSIYATYTPSGGGAATPTPTVDIRGQTIINGPMIIR